MELFEERQLELALEKSVADHARAYQASFPQMREITAVAEVARAYHGMPMAVASNGIRANVVGSLRGAGLLALFDSVVGVDEVEQGKPRASKPRSVPACAPMTCGNSRRRAAYSIWAM